MAIRYESALMFPDNLGVVDENSNELLYVSATASAVNYIAITNAATGVGPSFLAAGDDTNIDLILDGKGTGNATDSSGNRYLTTADEGTGNGLDADTLDGVEAAGFVAVGGDTMTGALVMSGAGIQFDDAQGILDANGNELVLFQTVASAVNYFDLFNSATGNDLVIASAGDDANIDIDITPKGSGQLLYNGVEVATSAGTHTQNTDTGTTATDFHIDSDNTGPRLKNSGGELQIRNSGDSAYANVTAEDVTVNGNLTVSGTTTTINTETITLDDNIIVLNNNEAGTPSENAGVEVERGTSTNSQLLWDESSDYWSINDGTTTKKAARVHSELVGDTAATQITVNHALATENIVVSVRYAAGTEQMVAVDWRNIDADNIRVDFESAPATDEFRVTVVG